MQGKSTSITYSECGSAALDIRHAKRMRRIAVCGLPGSTTFFYIIPQTALFYVKKNIEI